MKPIEIRTLPVESLIPATYNPRKVSSKARTKLKASLEAFGLVEPLVWNERRGRVVGGHLRLQLLKELGVAEVTVSVVDLDEAREKALNVVLNNLEAQGRFDSARLAALLAELEPLPELEQTGFDAATLKNLTMVPEIDAPQVCTDEAVEVTIVAAAPVYEAIAPRLDELIREFDLVTHVKRI